MKYLISALAIVFFLSTIVFTQAQDKQQVKSNVKVEKAVKQDGCCSTDKSSDKTKKESCGTEKSKSKTEDACCAEDQLSSKTGDDCCKTDKSKTTEGKK